MAMELLSEEGGCPIRISLTDSVSHSLILGKTGSGKSILAANLLIDVLINGGWIAAVDVVKPDGTGSFSELTYQVGGNYRNLQTGGNPLEPPDLRHCSQDVWQEKITQFKETVSGLILSMVAMDGPGSDLVPALVRKALSIFYSDRTSVESLWNPIFDAGIESERWQQQPTFRDLIGLFSSDILDAEQLYGEKAQEICAQIRLKLDAWLERPLGQSFCRPRDYRDDVRFVVYSFYTLSKDESRVFVQRIFIEVTRNTLRYTNSVFFCDEIPILMQHQPIAATIARLISTGRKQGNRVILASQGPEAIANSPFAAQILDNISLRLTGVIEPSAVDAYQRIFGYPRELILPCADRRFYPSRQGIFSRWLVDRAGLLTPARFYPNYLLLALTANQPDEMAARHVLLHEHFPNDPTRAMTTFAHLLSRSFKSGKPIQSVMDSWLLTQT